MALESKSQGHLGDKWLLTPQNSQQLGPSWGPHWGNHRDPEMRNQELSTQPPAHVATMPGYQVVTAFLPIYTWGIGVAEDEAVWDGVKNVGTGGGVIAQQVICLSCTWSTRVRFPAPHYS